MHILVPLSCLLRRSDVRMQCLRGKKWSIMPDVFQGSVLALWLIPRSALWTGDNLGWPLITSLSCFRFNTPGKDLLPKGGHGWEAFGSFFMTPAGKLCKVWAPPAQLTQVLSRFKHLIFITALITGFTLQIIPHSFKFRATSPRVDRLADNNSVNLQYEFINSLSPTTINASQI